MTPRFFGGVFPLLLAAVSPVFAYLQPFPLGGPTPTSHIKFDASGVPYYLAGNNLLSGSNPLSNYDVFLSPTGTLLNIAAFAVKPDGSVIMAANNEILQVAPTGFVSFVAPLSVVPNDMALDPEGNIYLTATRAGPTLRSS